MSDNQKDANLKKIMVVDDEEDIRTIISMSFDLAGDYSLEMFSSAADLLKRIDEVKPDLIISDVVMPEMTGPELLEHLRGNSGWKELPIVFLTASAKPKELESYRSLGKWGVLTKPFDPVTIADEIISLWKTLVKDEKTKNLEDKITSLQEAFVKELPEKMDEIQKAFQNLKENPEDATVAKELFHLTHAMSGCAGTLKLNDVYSSAHKVSERLKMNLYQEKECSEEDLTFIKEQINQLHSRTQ